MAIILAAGKGTRLKSTLDKVLHTLGGVPLLAHVIESAAAAEFERIAVVLAQGMNEVSQLIHEIDPTIEIFIQKDQRGTADAVLAARPVLENFEGDVVVLYGDTPLLRAQTLRAVRRALDHGSAVAVMGFEALNPAGYGRLITNADGDLLGVREDKDASQAERDISLCNSGVMGFRGDQILKLLDRIGSDNAKGEYYLTDAVELAYGQGLKPVVVTCGEEETLGVNSRGELARAEALLQDRFRANAMENGATLIAPETVYMSADTVIGRDVLIEPHVVLSPGVTLEDGVTVKAFSYLEGARVKRNAVIGPFARLRPGSEIGEAARIGNFVEVKNAVFDAGAKANHLTYVGDAHVGSGANIGAGTITCNYDGFDKHHTEIGEGAFIGSNSSLVAPLTIGKGAYIGSGSAITKNVADNALAITRAPQQQREGWAAKLRTRRKRSKGDMGGKLK